MSRDHCELLTFRHSRPSASLSFPPSFNCYYYMQLGVGVCFMLIIGELFVAPFSINAMGVDVCAYGCSIYVSVLWFLRHAHHALQSALWRPFSGVCLTGLALLEELSKARLQPHLAGPGAFLACREIGKIGRTNRPFLGCFRFAVLSDSGTPSRLRKEVVKIK